MNHSVEPKSRILGVQTFTAAAAASQGNCLTDSLSPLPPIPGAGGFVEGLLYSEAKRLKCVLASL